MLSNLLDDIGRRIAVEEHGEAKDGESRQDLTETGKGGRYGDHEGIVKCSGGNGDKKRVVDKGVGEIDLDVTVDPLQQVNGRQQRPQAVRQEHNVCSGLRDARGRA